MLGTSAARVTQRGDRLLICGTLTAYVAERADGVGCGSSKEDRGTASHGRRENIRIAGAGNNRRTLGGDGAAGTLGQGPVRLVARRFQRRGERPQEDRWICPGNLDAEDSYGFLEGHPSRKPQVHPARSR